MQYTGLVDDFEALHAYLDSVQLFIDELKAIYDQTV